MKTLTANIYRIIARAINTHGTYNPSEISYLFEEDLTQKQYDAIIPFLQWCHNNGLVFGIANYNQRYQQYLRCK